MEDFNNRKKQYLEKLRNNTMLVEAIMNKRDTNSPEVMRIVFDPQTENELTLDTSITTLFADIINMNFSEGNTTIEDFSQEPIISLFKNVILALKSNDEKALNTIKESLTNNLTPEKIGKLLYDLIMTFVLNQSEALDYLAEQCGFDTFDYLSSNQFMIYFQQANAKINEMTPQINFAEKIDVNNQELLEYIKGIVTSFHESYQRDFENDKHPKL